MELTQVELIQVELTLVELILVELILVELMERDEGEMLSLSILILMTRKLISMIHCMQDQREQPLQITLRLILLNSFISFQ